jgi:predicted short-subunit dehydrogenase-like oxidoreductase (DUF2520 family)
MIQTISAIGAGNVATHLIPDLYRSGFVIRQILANRKASAEALANQVRAEPVTTWSALDQQSDLYLVATPDRLIPEISNYWHTGQGIVVHTAGGVRLEALEGVAPAIGVCYPLQTFDRTRDLNLQEVPFFLEARTAETLKALQGLAERAGWPWQVMGSDQRQHLHLAAILTNNFTTYLFRMAADQLQQQGLSFEQLQPLIRETIDKALGQGPEAAQTGPAKRGDTQTIAHHQSLLNNPDEQQVYELLSQTIYRYFNA